MNYSDKDMRAATQVAYMNFNQSEVNKHPDWTIKQHFENNAQLAREWSESDPELYNEIMNGSYQTWKIRDYENRNVENGFSACCIDTGDGNAIVGFRGSESASDMDNLIKDWIIADGGLINSTETGQQQYARAYMKKIYSEYGDDYNSFSLTGHSLGGNLAEHAAITSSDACYNKIDRVVNLDGPGFSDEYIQAHESAIAKHADKIDHYQYSLVGAILNALPGTNYQTMLASDESGPFLKHSTKYIIYDDSGNMIISEPDEMSIFIHGFTNTADDGTFLPGAFAAVELLIGLHSPVFRLFFGADMYTYMERYKNEAKQRYESAKIDASFKVHTDALLTSANEISNCSRDLVALCAEVESIKSNLSMFIKLGALFTVTCKLRIIESSIEKCATIANNMSNSAEQCANLYIQCENSVKSI